MMIYSGRRKLLFMHACHHSLVVRQEEGGLGEWVQSTPFPGPDAKERENDDGEEITSPACCTLSLSASAPCVDFDPPLAPVAPAYFDLLRVIVVLGYKADLIVRLAHKVILFIGGDNSLPLLLSFLQ